MDSRFSHLYKRDSSVSMIRVKMSRRRSQTQKESREKVQNLRRQLDQLPELELSSDVSTLEKSVLPSQETGHKTKADKNNSALEERKMMLARFKENKILQKEKEKREKEKKGTFKFGLYRPQPLGYLPLNPVVLTTKKTTESVQSSRVTRSMKQHLQPKPVENQPINKKAEPPSTRANKSSGAAVLGRTVAVKPVVRAPVTRSIAKSVAAAVTTKSVTKPAPDPRPSITKSASRQPAAPILGDKVSLASGKKEMKVAVVNSFPPKEEKMVEEVKVTPVSFAPQGFVFQPPCGLSTFTPTPLSPRSAEAFLSPSFLVEPQIESTNPISPPSDSSEAPPLSTPPPCMSENCPGSASYPPPASSASPSLNHSFSSNAPSEPQHDVGYFRDVMATETERLTGLSEFWEVRFDDCSIPEEMRDRMRTAVGQARLLMKERFGQFRGLVDDCDFARGEKITTCTDLQGFWDMVYYQVEDVDKKFNSLKEAEARGWQEEIRPVTRERKVVRKPSAVGGKTGAGVGASAAAKSRLAAVKAAMKAKQATVKAAESLDRAQDDPASDNLANALTAQTVVFNGGFFQVESPAKSLGAVRRSSRLSVAPSAQCSPRGAKYSTPGRQQRFAAVTLPSPLPCILTPSKNAPSTSPAASPLCTSKQHVDPLPCALKPEQNRSLLCMSPNRESHTQLSQTVHNNIQPELMEKSADQDMYQSPKPHNSPCKLEEDLPLHLVHSASSTKPDESVEAPAVTQETSLTQEQTEEPVFAEACITTTQADAVDSCLSPASSDKTDVCVGASSLISSDCKVTEDQESESISGLDFERYLQPTARCSLSPVQSMGVDRLSLGLDDAEMESPQSWAEVPVRDALITPTDDCQSDAVHPRAEGESETVSVSE